MSEIKAKIRRHIKNNRFYQDYRAKKYFRDELKHVEGQTKRRVCYLDGDKANQIVNMLSMIDIQIDLNSRFQCWIDEGLFTFKSETMTDNVPPNYQAIMDNSIYDMIKAFSKIDNDVARSSVALLKGVLLYIDRIINELERTQAENTTQKENRCRAIQIYENMKNSSASSLDDAFQRILLWQSFFWQSHHRLIGLGRLDKILAEFIDENEPDEVFLDRIRDFYEALHKHYAFKSNRISLGDTGQIIIVGGLEISGTYYCNRLTYGFIEAFINHRLPDPKVLLRVSEKMPDELLEKAINCISTGIGCPLLSNDDVVIPALIQFGYTEEDANNYVTSACWEPLAYGKSLEKNNLADINYGSAIVELYSDDRFLQCKSFDDVKRLFFAKTKEEIDKKLDGISSIRWEPDPLMSMLTAKCLEKGKDISEGGAEYNDYGLLSAGMANAVNSLLNIKHLAFSLPVVMNLDELKDAASNNYLDRDVKRKLSDQKYYGTDDEEVIELTKQIVEFTSEELRNYRNFLGGTVKFGLSTSNYMEEGRITSATLDGRCKGEALGVHITNPRGIPYTELVNFASKLNYNGNRSNGNVLDYFVSPSVMNKEREKFVQFIKQSIKAGFFQMQLNVVSSDKLIDAKKNPGKYPDLIVRVWGFSAYFDDLPEDYQNVLIERALASEGKSVEVRLS